MSALYFEIRPSPRLAPYIECYWSKTVEKPSPDQIVLPDACADIVFVRQQNTIDLKVVGLLTTPLRVSSAPGDAFFGVRFRPGMARSFIPEVVTLNDRIEQLDRFWGSKTRSLCEELASSDDHAKARLLDRFIQPRQPIHPIQHALSQWITEDIPLDRVASETGFSLRQFRRIALECTGVSPKYFQRILRFRRSLERIQTESRSTRAPERKTNWADCSAACGYFDQAHFIHEFQNFAGMTPGRYLQSIARAGT